MVAKAVLLLIHEPAVVGDSVVLLLTHTEDAPVRIGRALTVKLNPLPALTQPLEVETIKVPVYVPAATPAGTERLMGLAGNGALLTFPKPAVVAAELQKI